MRPFIAWVWTQRPPSRIAAIGFVPPTAAMEIYCGLPGNAKQRDVRHPYLEDPGEAAVRELVKDTTHQRFCFHVELPDIGEDIPASLPHHISSPR